MDLNKQQKQRAIEIAERLRAGAFIDEIRRELIDGPKSNAEHLLHWAYASSPSMADAYQLTILEDDGDWLELARETDVSLSPARVLACVQLIDGAKMLCRTDGYRIHAIPTHDDAPLGAYAIAPHDINDKKGRRLYVATHIAGLKSWDMDDVVPEKVGECKLKGVTYPLLMHDAEHVELLISGKQATTAARHKDGSKMRYHKKAVVKMGWLEDAISQRNRCEHDFVYHKAEGALCGRIRLDSDDANRKRVSVIMTSAIRGQ